MTIYLPLPNLVAPWNDLVISLTLIVPTLKLTLVFYRNLCSSYLSYSLFSDKSFAILTVVNNISNHSTFTAIVRHSHWRNAMAYEIQALEANQTWTLVPLFLDKKPIDRVFTRKLCITKLLASTWGGVLKVIIVVLNMLFNIF